MKPQFKTATGTQDKTAELTITVLFTTPADTQLALKSAVELAGDLGATIRLVVMRVVPFPLPLNTPPIPIEFTERQARKLAQRAALESEVQIYDCRDREETLLNVLTPQSVVVIGGKQRWLPTKQTRLARLLRQNGHDVVLVDSAAKTKWQT